jgi:hypothetical protein
MSDDEEKKYAYQLQERKRTAKSLMQQTGKIVDGTIVINTAEIVGKMKSKKK